MSLIHKDIIIIIHDISYRKLVPHLKYDWWLQLLGWLVAAPIILGTLYFIFLPMFKFLVPKFSGAPEKKEHDS